MRLTDPVADMLARIKNALKERKANVDIPHSSLKENILKVMVSEGYVAGYESLQRGTHKVLRVKLKYDEKKTPVISKLERVSKPGRRYYVNSGKIPKVLGGFGVSVLSTSRGVMTDYQARKEKVGGELLLKVW